MLRIYMDESGQITSNYKGQRYFVMAYVLTKDCKSLHKCFTKARLEAVSNDVHSVRNLEKKRELKGTHMDEVIKSKIYDELLAFYQNHQSFEIALMVVDNKYLKSIFRKNKGRSFSYFMACAIKTLNQTSMFSINAAGTWLLIDDRNISPRSKTCLQDFLNIQLQLNDRAFKHDIQVSYFDSKKEQLIQLTDLVANTALRALNSRSVEAKENLNLLMPLLTGEKIFKFGKMGDEMIEI